MRKNTRNKWHNELVNEIVTDTRSWRLENVVSPTGVTLVSIRAYARTKANGPIRTGQGFALAKETALTDLIAVSSLVAEAITNLENAPMQHNGLYKAGPYVLYKAKTQRYLVSVDDGKVKVSSDESKAMRFTRISANKFVTDRDLGSAWVPKDTRK